MKAALPMYIFVIGFKNVYTRIFVWIWNLQYKEVDFEKVHKKIKPKSFLIDFGFGFGSSE